MTIYYLTSFEKSQTVLKLFKTSDKINYELIHTIPCEINDNMLFIVHNYFDDKK